MHTSLIKIPSHSNYYFDDYNPFLRLKRVVMAKDLLVITLVKLNSILLITSSLLTYRDENFVVQRVTIYLTKKSYKVFSSLQFCRLDLNRKLFKKRTTNGAKLRVQIEPFLTQIALPQLK